MSGSEGLLESSVGKEQVRVVLDIAEALGVNITEKMQP